MFKKIKYGAVQLVKFIHITTCLKKCCYVFPTDVSSEIPENTVFFHRSDLTTSRNITVMYVLVLTWFSCLCSIVYIPFNVSCAILLPFFTLTVFFFQIFIFFSKVKIHPYTFKLYWTNNVFIMPVFDTDLHLCSGYFYLYFGLHWSVYSYLKIYMCKAIFVKLFSSIFYFIIVCLKKCSTCSAVKGLSCQVVQCIVSYSKMFDFNIGSWSSSVISIYFS